MKPKLNLLLLLFTSLNLFTFSISKAITYPIQINNSFSIQSANQFDVNQIESVGALQSRMKTLLQFGELNATGFYVTAGTTLQVNVSRLAGSGTEYGKIVITSRYKAGQSGSETQTITLNSGVNNINVTINGNVYIVYSSSSSDPTRKLRFTFNSGYTAMPMFIKDNTSTSEWLDMLQNNPSTPDVSFLFKRGVMVLDRARIESYKNNDFNKIIAALDDIVEVELAGAGFITTTDLTNKNRMFFNPLYFTTNDPGRDQDNPHATNPGLVRVPIDWIATTTHIFTGGAWGISHEIGHHIQQNAWDWGVNTEVQVNIGTMMARKMLYPSETGMESGTSWRAAGFYLNKNNIGKDYNAGTLDLKAKIPLFWQLQLAFGNNDFYKRFYTYVRENAVNSGSADTEKSNFMKTANTISGKNLVDYFKQWGLNPTTSQTNTLNGMGLQKPSVSPLTYSEGILLENFTLLKDTIVYEGKPINYHVVAMSHNGVKKVEFYDGATKIGESTGFPFQLTFTPTFGVHPITAKLIDANDNVLATTSVKNVTATRVEISSPQNNDSFMLGSPVLIRAEAAAVTGNPIQKVEFYAGGIKLGEQSTYPYQISVNNLSTNRYQISAKVYYQNGDVSQSVPIAISVGAILPDADTYVRDGSYAGNNYGDFSTLELKEDGSSFKRYVYLRFKLSDLAESNFSEAKLRLNIVGSNNAVANKTDWNLYFVSDDTWGEKTLNFNNQPATGDLLATKRSVASGMLEWDITNQVNTEAAGDKYISLVLKSSTVGASYNNNFASKENEDITISPLLTLVTAEQSPIVTKIILPQNATYQAVGATVEVKVNTTTKQSNPTQSVALYDNNVKIAELFTAPYDFSISNISRGHHQLVAKALYQDGTLSVSNEISINVGILDAEADAYVQNGGTNQGVNNGNATSLVVKNDGVGYYRETFLRFNLTDIPLQNFEKAVLKLNIIGANTNVTDNNNQWDLYFIEDDTWTETGINFTNRPTVRGDLLSSTKSVKTGSAEWDISNQLNTELNGDKQISLLLVATQVIQKGDVSFASKEHENSNLRPVLQLYTTQEVLPVNFISFNAKADGNRAKLTWSTASEKDNAYFEVEKSTDGSNFSLLTKVTANGNATSTSNYSTYDINPAQTTYYRLAQVDNDGQRTTLGSAVVSFKLDNAVKVSTYPNPTTTQVSLSIATYTGKVLVTVKDVNGRSLKQFNGNTGQGQTMVLDVSDLASGLYFFEVSGDNFKQTEKVIVK